MKPLNDVSLESNIDYHFHLTNQEEQIEVNSQKH